MHHSQKTAPAHLSRRAWLVAAGAAWGLGRADRCWGLMQQAVADPKAEADVRKQADLAGIKSLFINRRSPYFGIGNAPDAFRLKALEICSLLSVAYQNHFTSKGFEVRRPMRQLTVVILADAKSYSKFTGEEVQPGVGGHYDLDANRLVMFDNRAQGQLEKDRAERANLLSLVHEAMHQLTFNTDLLERRADTPVAISEGLATYGEQWQLNGGVRLGQVNTGRLDGLRQALTQQPPAVKWVPVAQLLSEDKLFEQGGGNDLKVQLLYGESWLLVYHLMQPRNPARFRDYLQAIRLRDDAKSRLEDAKKYLGDLGKLDQEVRQLAKKLLL